MYAKGVVIPKVKPNGRRAAIVTFLPSETSRRTRSDEEIWEEIQPTLRKIRKQLFEKMYPSRYAKRTKKRA